MDSQIYGIRRSLFNQKMQTRSQRIIEARVLGQSKKIENRVEMKAHRKRLTVRN